MAENAPGTVTPSSTTDAEGWRVKRSWVRVLVLNLVSLGFYSVYWFYQVRKQIFTEQKNSSSSAGLHTLGLVVPILNWFILYWLYKDLAVIAKQQGREVSALLLFLLTFFVGAIGQILAQEELNKYWDAKSGGKATAAKVTAAEVIVSLLGAFFFIFFIVAIVVGAVAEKNNAEQRGGPYDRDVQRDDSSAGRSERGDESRPSKSSPEELAAFEQITPGMPREEVEKLLGQPSRECIVSETKSNKYEGCTYKRINVQYKGGSVLTKSKY